ncbi:MAG: DUF1549 domain-containing protein [Planctomycetaceae bacterium]|nr:DUF1549 domain-containing protein [Planctomycetaceae bacterium]
MRRMTAFLGMSLALMVFLLPSTAVFAEGPEHSSNPFAVAREVDRLIGEELAAQGQPPTGLVNDQDFLRRVSLDLTGRIPSPEDIQQFARQTAPDKRDQKVQQLLASEDYARNWAAYWRDVIFSRATDQRAVNFQAVFESWMRDQLRENVSWSDITRQLLTATGDARENGATGLILAHEGNPEELAGEVSRIFLGIQVQCANCHNHPTDTWTREQFHQLAAFFPRVRARLLPNQTPPTMEVTSQDFARPNPRDLFNEPERMLRQMDRNRDGRIDQEEASRFPQFGRLFERLIAVGDKDGDKALNAKEIKELPEPPMNARNTIEHFMPDLSDPTAQGTAMQPVFFLGEKAARPGLRDVERRGLLADYLSDTGNEWFAKAFVNRVWSELLGEGFYQPVDDLGPLREARHEAALNLLSQEFVATGYDMKWLFRVIANTQAYQRKLKSRSVPVDESLAFACATPTRLRSDQIFDAIMQLAGPQVGLGRPGAGRPGMEGRGGRFNPKRQFADLFGFDPSTPQDEVQETIPQALFMMNSSLIEALVSARGNTALARLLRQSDDDEYVLRQLYLMTLSREPTDRELQICQEYFLDVRNRTEVLEDIYWSLLNSSEFITKR